MTLPTAQRQNGTPRILILDDEHGVRSEMVILLSEEGFDCLACGTAEQAERLMELNDDIAVAVVDVRLPGASGLDFIARSRSRPGHVLPTRFIVISGHVDLDSAMQALRLKVDDLLPKPIDPDALIRAIHRGLDQVSSDILGRGVTATLAIEADQARRPAPRRGAAQRGEAQRAPARRAAQRMAPGTDRLLRLVTDELRQPLVPIIDACEQLMMAQTEPRDSSVLGRQMRYEAVKLLERLDSILDLVRLTSGPVSLRLTVEAPARLAELVRQNFEQAGRARDVRLDLDVLGAPSAALLDRGLWLQAIAHVVRNALEHSPRGTSVLIRVARTDNALVCEVSDAGPGMDAETLERALTPFRQGSEGRDRTKSGLGLGLTLSQHFLNAHGGVLSIRPASNPLNSRNLVILTIPLELPQ